jgi:hypothetical protein
MVTVPTPALSGDKIQLGAEQRAPLDTPFFNLKYPDMSFNARQLQSLGEGLSGLANEFQRRTDERILLELEGEWQTFENQLFDPQSGVLAQHAGNAIGLTEAIQASVDAWKDEHIDRAGLSHSGRIAAEKYINSISDAAVDRTRNHETVEDQRYKLGMLDGLVEAQVDRIALAPPGPDGDAIFDAALTKVIGYTEQISSMTGWSSEQYDQEVERRLSQAIAARAVALADVHRDPSAALTLLEAHADQLDSEVYLKLHPVLTEAARNLEINAAVLDVVMGQMGLVSTGEASTDTQAVVDMAMGYGPRQNIADLYAGEPGIVPGSFSNIVFNVADAQRTGPRINHILSATAADVLGPGGKVYIFSGYRQGADKGNHQTLGAADAVFERADGSRVRHGDPEWPMLMMGIAMRGALGIGYGPSYMSESPGSFHADVVRHGVTAQGRTWGGMPADMAARLTAAMNSADAQAARAALGIPEGLAAHVDRAGASLGDIVPTEVAALYTQFGGDPEAFMQALSTYNSLQGQMATAVNRQKEGLITDIYTQLNEASLAGEYISWEDATTVGQRVALGTDVETVRTLWENTMGTEKIVTEDRGFEIMDRVMELAASPDPDDHRALLDMNFTKEVRPYVDDQIYGTLETVRQNVIQTYATRDIPRAPVIPEYSTIKTVVSDIVKAGPVWEELDAAGQQALVNSTIARVTRMAEDYSAGEQVDVDANLVRALLSRESFRTNLDVGGADDVTLTAAIALADETWETWEDMADEGIAFLTSSGQAISLDAGEIERLATVLEQRDGVPPSPSQLLIHAHQLYMLTNPSAAYGMRVYNRSGVVFPDDIPPAALADVEGLNADFIAPDADTVLSIPPANGAGWQSEIDALNEAINKLMLEGIDGFSDD